MATAGWLVVLVSSVSLPPTAAFAQLLSPQRVFVRYQQFVWYRFRHGRFTAYTACGSAPVAAAWPGSEIRSSGPSRRMMDWRASTARAKAAAH
ncbi:MAG: hypothetical protein GEU99_17435 [Luteitalea sp.]|nr:hypothetical protein [Luteitalea sp.]